MFKEATKVLGATTVVLEQPNTPRTALPRWTGHASRNHDPTHDGSPTRVASREARPRVGRRTARLSGQTNPICASPASCSTDCSASTSNFPLDAPTAARVSAIKQARRSHSPLDLATGTDPTTGALNQPHITRRRDDRASGTGRKSAPCLDPGRDATGDLLVRSHRHPRRGSPRCRTGRIAS